MKAQSQSKHLAGKWMVAAFALASYAGVAQGGIIISDYPAEPTVTPFPDNEPPTNPPIADGEDADHTTVTSLSEYEYSTGGEEGAYTVTDVDATLSATSAIRIPQGNNDAGDDLYKHEYGHHRLAKFEYAKKAKTKMDAAVRSVQGRTYTTLAAAQAAVDSALDDALASIDRQIGVLQTAYDTITNHGDKDTPTASDAYDSITNGKDSAATSGSGRAAVDTSRVWAGSGDPPTVEFIDAGLRFAGDLVIDQTSDPFDPLRNLGEFSIGNMIPIGLNDNGTVLLSDAGFAINAIGGGTLVTGALFEASYGASEVPGFAGMIQASLWIAPQMWGGVDNTIGSTMLGELASASNAGTLMTFWFLSDQALFSAAGEPVAVGAVTGKVRIGYTVPTPGSILMLALGLTACVWGVRRR